MQLQECTFAEMPFFFEKGGAYYERAEVSAFSRRPFQVIIEGSVGNEAGHVIAIDDTSFSSDCWLYEGQLPSGKVYSCTYTSVG